MTKLGEKYPELSNALGKQDTNYVKNFIENNSKEIIGDALYWCAHDGRLEDLKFFVAQGVDVDTQDEDGSVLCMEHQVENQISIMKWLIEDQHANIHIRDWEGGSIPLHWASLKGNVAAIELLITHGSDVNAQIDGKRHLCIKQVEKDMWLPWSYSSLMDQMLMPQINGKKHLCIKQAKEDMWLPWSYSSPMDQMLMPRTMKREHLCIKQVKKDMWLPWSYSSPMDQMSIFKIQMETLPYILPQGATNLMQFIT